LLVQVTRLLSRVLVMHSAVAVQDSPSARKPPVWAQVPRTFEVVEALIAVHKLGVGVFYGQSLRL